MASILQDFGELDDRSESVLTFSTNSLLASSISDSRIGVLSCDNGDVHTVKYHNYWFDIRFVYVFFVFQ